MTKVAYEVVRPSVVQPIVAQLNQLRLDGFTGMRSFLDDMEEHPDYMESHALVALARVDEHVVGWATLCLDVRGRARFNVFVTEAQRQRGIGTELVRALAASYAKVAKVPPTVAPRYLAFYQQAAPWLFMRSTG